MVVSARRQCFPLLLGALLVACIAASPAQASTRTAAPSFVSLNVFPRVVPAQGGPATVRVRVRRAYLCRISGLPGVVGAARRRCQTGSTTATVKLSPNQTSRTVSYSVRVTAVGHGSASRTRTTSILQAAATTMSAPTPPVVAPPQPPIGANVVGLSPCQAGPHCFYGPITTSYPTYGNTAPALLGDCTFAAAALWQQIVLGRHPDPTQIGYEFADAGGTEAGGLAQERLWSYWHTHGIAGSVLNGITSYTRSQADVENGVRDYTALIVELRFGQGWGFAQYTMPAGAHDVVVDGFTPVGPLVVSWGQTLQMTWAQWEAEAVGMWGINAT
jgi:hypothetical protein